MNTVIPRKIALADYNKFKEDFNEFIAAMVNAKLHPKNLPFTTRMRLLTRMEAAYLNIYKFGDDLMAEMPKLAHDKTNERYFLRALERDNIIKVSEGENRDIFITAPPLGDRYGGNAEMIAYFANKAWESAAKSGAKFNPTQEVCVIVKQFCRCKDVAMGTMENREIHSLTDTILFCMGIDDNPWYADFCYIWCESSNPRTEIVITDRATASQYDDYVSEIYEPEPTASQRYNAATAKKSRMDRNIKRVGDILAEVDGFCLKYAMLNKVTCRQLCHMTKALMEITTDLREPFISSEKHEYSHLYSRDFNEDGKKRKADPHTETTADDLYEIADRCGNYDPSTKILTIKTSTPFTTISRRGKSLCEEQETILALTMPKSNSPLAYHSNDDLAVTLNRATLAYNPKTADSDNLNFTFLRPIQRRTKIIYAKANKKWTKEYDCEVSIRPKSSIFFL